eukprot:9489766-Pyramimonas_sp.AAC.1
MIIQQMVPSLCSYGCCAMRPVALDSVFSSQQPLSFTVLSDPLLADQWKHFPRGGKAVASAVDGVHPACHATDAIRCRRGGRVPLGSYLFACDTL